MEYSTYFADSIIQWYLKHQRDLPWRATQDPYKIWLSEIILQQTRVDQGLPYYLRFVEKFPALEAFARAEEDDILLLWQGLGYYSRARNMHKAAQQVLSEYSGNFPTAYEDLLRLKGVGAYTAAAIASFSANEVRAVVDGNVYRLLARYFGIALPVDSNVGKRHFQTVADELIDHKQPGLYNQAIMEFGSQQCKPQNPNCEQCVLQSTCHAYAENQVKDLPVKGKKRASTQRYFNYLIIQDAAGRLVMEKRGAGDIWENLYELPLIESSSLINAAERSDVMEDFAGLVCEKFGESCQLTYWKGPLKHVLSHQIIYANAWIVTESSLENEKKVNYNYVNLKELNTLAKPKLVSLILEELLN